MPIFRPGFFPGTTVLLFRQKDLKPLELGVGLVVPFDSRLIQRLRNSHGSNSACLFLDWTPRLNHAEGP